MKIENRTATVTTPSDTQILMTREFNAPKHLVFKAWTTPELIKRWWSGGRGEVTVAEVDLRVGGTWRYVIASEHGEVGFNGEYLEIVPNERIVNTEIYEQAPEGTKPADNFVTFTETDGRGKIELLMECHSREVRDAVLASGMEEGLQDSWDAMDRVAQSLK